MIGLLFITSSFVAMEQQTHYTINTQHKAFSKKYSIVNDCDRAQSLFDFDDKDPLYNSVSLGSLADVGEIYYALFTAIQTEEQDTDAF